MYPQYSIYSYAPRTAKGPNGKASQSRSHVSLVVITFGTVEYDGSGGGHNGKSSESFIILHFARGAGMEIVNEH